MIHEPHNPGQDKDLDRELEALLAEWDRSGGDASGGAEPPELVDMAVMNAARRDLERDRKRRPLRWLGGFATATVVVLAIGVVLQQEPSTPEPVSRDKQDAPLAAPAPAQQEQAARLRREQQALPPAEPQAQAREAKRQALELRTAPAAAAGEEAESDSAADFYQVNPSVSSPLAVEKQADALEEAVMEEAIPGPEAWIERMLELKASGQLERLAVELAAFRAQFPDHPLPDELLAENP